MSLQNSYSLALVWLDWPEWQIRPQLNVFFGPFLRCHNLHFNPCFLAFIRIYAYAFLRKYVLSG